MSCCVSFAISFKSRFVLASKCGQLAGQMGSGNAKARIGVGPVMSDEPAVKRFKAMFHIRRCSKHSVASACLVRSLLRWVRERYTVLSMCPCKCALRSTAADVQS